MKKVEGETDMGSDKEIEKKIASGVTLWWLHQGRFSEDLIISRIKNLEILFLILFLMQTLVIFLILFRP